MAIRKETVINSPPEKVFEYIADLSRHSEWGTHQLKIESVSEGPTAVGSKFKSVGYQMGADSHDDVTVVEYSPPQRFVFESSTKAGRFRHAFDAQPEGDGTRLAKSFETLELSLMTKLMMPVIAITEPGLLTKDLQRIKARLEQPVGV